MTAAFGGKNREGFSGWVQDVEDRLRRLEARNRVAVGQWSITAQGNNLVAVYVPTGEAHVLAVPDPPPPEP